MPDLPGTSIQECDHDGDDAEHEVDAYQFSNAVDAGSGGGAVSGTTKARIGSVNDQHEHHAHDQPKQHHDVDIPPRLGGSPVKYKQYREAAEQDQRHGVPDH